MNGTQPKKFKKNDEMALLKQPLSVAVLGAADFEQSTKDILNNFLVHVFEESWHDPGNVMDILRQVRDDLKSELKSHITPAQCTFLHKAINFCSQEYTLYSIGGRRPVRRGYSFPAPQAPGAGVGRHDNVPGSPKETTSLLATRESSFTSLQNTLSRSGCDTGPPTRESSFMERILSPRRRGAAPAVAGIPPVRPPQRSRSAGDAAPRKNKSAPVTQAAGQGIGGVTAPDLVATLARSREATPPPTPSGQSFWSRAAASVIDLVSPRRRAVSTGLAPEARRRSLSVGPTIRPQQRVLDGGVMRSPSQLPALHELAAGGVVSPSHVSLDETLSPRPVSPRPVLGSEPRAQAAFQRVLIGSPPGITRNTRSPVDLTSPDAVTGTGATDPLFPAI